MPVKIPVSDARKKLSELLKDVSSNPGHVYEITVNDIVFGELHAPSSKGLRVGAGDALLMAAGQMKERKLEKQKGKTARQHDKYLYPPRTKRGRDN